MLSFVCWGGGGVVSEMYLSLKNRYKTEALAFVFPNTG